MIVVRLTGRWRCLPPVVWNVAARVGMTIRSIKGRSVLAIVTIEFVRQRFWVDSDVGTVFWHDHALGRIT